MNQKVLVLVAIIVILFLSLEVYLSTTTISLKNPLRSQHIWLIIEENHSASQIYSDFSAAPYINSIGRRYVELGNYVNLIQQAPLNMPPYAVHPSLPNYLALTSGSTWWATNDNISAFSDVFSGGTPVNTTLGQIEGGRFALPPKWPCPNAQIVSGCIYNTTYSGRPLGTATINRQSYEGTLLIVHNVKVITVGGCSASGSFPCTGGDGDQGLEVTDPTWNSGKNNMHIEITSLFQNPKNASVYGFISRPISGQTYTVIGTAFCDPDHNSDIPAWHSLTAIGGNTCWEMHPVISMYPEGSTPPPNPNLFSDLQDNGLSWRVFEEGMPSPCYRNDFGNYVVRHNPAALYANLASGLCQRYDLGYNSTFLPTPSVNFTWISPDICDDMHSCNITTADNYLSQIVPKIMATQDYQRGNGIIFIVWDEGSGTGTNDRIPAVIISPLVKHGYVSMLSYDHYSFLHTIEYMLGLPDLGRNDATAPLITDIWN